MYVVAYNPHLPDYESKTIPVGKTREQCKGGWARRLFVDQVDNSVVITSGVDTPPARARRFTTSGATVTPASDIIQCDKATYGELTVTTIPQQYLTSYDGTHWTVESTLVPGSYITPLGSINFAYPNSTLYSGPYWGRDITDTSYFTDGHDPGNSSNTYSEWKPGVFYRTGGSVLGHDGIEYLCYRDHWSDASNDVKHAVRGAYNTYSLNDSEGYLLWSSWINYAGVYLHSSLSRGSSDVYALSLPIAGIAGDENTPLKWDGCVYTRYYYYPPSVDLTHRTGNSSVPPQYIGIKFTVGTVEDGGSWNIVLQDFDLGPWIASLYPQTWGSLATKIATSNTWSSFNTSLADDNLYTYLTPTPHNYDYIRIDGGVITDDAVYLNIGGLFTGLPINFPGYNRFCRVDLGDNSVTEVTIEEYKAVLDAHDDEQVTSCVESDGINYDYVVGFDDHNTSTTGPMLKKYAHKLPVPVITHLSESHYDDQNYATYTMSNGADLYTDTSPYDPVWGAGIIARKDPLYDVSDPQIYWWARYSGSLVATNPTPLTPWYPVTADNFPVATPTMPWSPAFGQEFIYHIWAYASRDKWLSSNFELQGVSTALYTASSFESAKEPAETDPPPPDIPPQTLSVTDIDQFGNRYALIVNGTADTATVINIRTGEQFSLGTAATGAIVLRQNGVVAATLIQQDKTTRIVKTSLNCGQTWS